MNKQEYLDVLNLRMQNVLEDYTFGNYKNQTTARKLSADFAATYQESYLWNRALYLSSNAATLVLERRNSRTAMRALKESAEIFENLSKVGLQYDTAYCTILSSICYDLAGYQANALCLMRLANPYVFEAGENGISVVEDDYILSHIRLLLLKAIPYAKNLLRDRRALQLDESADLSITLFNKALGGWYDSILDGADRDIDFDLLELYRFYSGEFRIHIAHLVHLIRARAVLYEQRSIWKRVATDVLLISNPIWTKYLKLLSHDPYDRTIIKPIERRVAKFEFWTSQLRALEMGLLRENSNFVVQMPTSAGKTFIAELAMVDALVKQPGKKCIYVAPFRALTNEKEDELANIFNKLGFSVSALSGSYEMDEFQQIVLEDTDVLIATPEKLDFLFRQNSNYFASVSLVVVDEGHIVGDVSTRASLLEFLVVRFKMASEQVKILFISAVMPPANANEYSMWLNGANDKVIRSLLYPDSPPTEEWEPTRKLIGNFIWSGNNGLITYRDVATENEQTRRRTAAFVPALIRIRQFAGRFPDGQNKAQTSASLAYVLSDTGNCLVFCAQVRDTERVGQALLNIISAQEAAGEILPDRFRVNRETEAWFFARKWFGERSHVALCLERGIGIHYGDMPDAVRRSVEADYAGGNLRILISTNTIGQGINFPIKHLIIHSTLITVGVQVSVRDFWNIVGRAGRAGKETEGQVIFVIKSTTDGRAYSRYTEKANIEAAFSIFLAVLNALRLQRITDQEFQQNMEIIAESYLLDLLTEEIVGTDDQALIERIIDNSLFKVQAESRNLDLRPVRNAFGTIAQTIRQTVPQELLPVFGQTGFTLKSNLAIDAFIDRERDALILLVETDDYLGLLEKILSLFGEGAITEVMSQKLSGIGRTPREIDRGPGSRPSTRSMENLLGQSESPQHLTGGWILLPLCLGNYCIYNYPRIQA
jgi:helicase